jgi:hypothetical protein
MDSSQSLTLQNELAEIVGHVRRKGVRLWAENGQLHYRAPKGALTPKEMQLLKGSTRQIAALLERDAEGQGSTGAESHPAPHICPLSFSQAAHWNLYELSGRRSLRQLASATRLQGRLNITALRMSLAEVVRHHEALRTRIVMCNGAPAQEILPTVDCELKVEDLTTLSERFQKVEINRIIEYLILKPIDVAVAPLFVVRLLRLCQDEHVLIVAMEHMISDAFSLGILLRDLFTAYIQAVKGNPISLPPVQVQFSDYAVWQRSAQTSWIEKHGKYWNERLKGFQRLRFPVDDFLPTSPCLGWGGVRLQIDESLKAELSQWCRLRQTTLVMGVFTAYVGLLLRWCNVSEALIQYQTDGRFSPKLLNTIGYFASVLYLRIKLLESDRFVDLLNQVINEFFKAYEHADSSYVEAQIPRPDFTRNSSFNWVPQSQQAESLEFVGSENAIVTSAVSFENSMLRNVERDTEPMVLLYDADRGVAGSIYFPQNRFSAATIERFGRNFQKFIGTLLRQPEGRVTAIPLVD